jgi:phenylacetate-CoA ligase
VRDKLGELWPGARVFDHHGMTEVGPVSYERENQAMQLCVIEEAYFAEVIDRETLLEVAEGEKGELVLTTLDRVACPLLRYRTGDLVEKNFFADGKGRKSLCLEGGVLGRVDEMVVVRGVNIYPTAIEKIIRSFPEVAEYQVIESTRDSMAELEIAVEPVGEQVDGKDLVQRIGRALANAFTLRIPVKLVGEGELPRFEFKSKRWVKG